MLVHFIHMGSRVVVMISSPRVKSRELRLLENIVLLSEMSFAPFTEPIQGRGLEAQMNNASFSPSSAMQKSTLMAGRPAGWCSSQNHRITARKCIRGK